MNDKLLQYSETHPLQLNVYLFFYIYIFIVLVIANVLPMSPENYFIFLFLGIAGISILFIQFRYGILVRKNSLEIFIKIPFKVTLQKLKAEGIIDINKIKFEHNLFHKLTKKKSIKYIFKKEDGIKLTMLNGEVFIISGFNADKIIEKIKL